MKYASHIKRAAFFSPSGAAACPRRIRPAGMTGRPQVMLRPLLQREGHRVPIQALQHAQEGPERRPPVIPMGTQDAGKSLFAVKGDPGELAAVVVQETRRQADAASGGHVDPRRIMVGAVEIFDFPGADQAVLDRPQRRRGAAADHQRPAVEIFLADQVFPARGSSRLAIR